MELESLRVQNYRCIGDSGWVSVDELTCLLGKNESGKTAFMEALEKINPSYDTGDYEPYRDYPRKDWPNYSDRHEDDPDTVASARFELESEDVSAIDEAFGRDLLSEQRVTVHRDYANERHWELSFDDDALIEYLLDSYEFDDDVRSQLREADSLTLEGENDGGTTEEPLASVESKLGGPPTEVVADEIGWEVLADLLPEFRYIGEYSIMDGTIEVEELIEKRDNDELTAGDYVFLSLLSVAGLDLEALQSADDWREKTTELEAASGTVSDQAMSYWSQSGDLRIRIDAANTGEEDQQVLDVRVENREYDVSVEFEQRSRGFRWFFSTFCQLSELQNMEEDLVLMLDEPGLNLHARAKQQFLSFLKTELAPNHPIVYTTHSPFMIDPENLHRTKLVMADPLGDRNVFGDVSAADDYTRFPLRNVFELDLMDTLLVRPQTLVVERKADHIYLYVVSKLLQDLGERGLDERWTVVPIKDRENIATFISLFGEEQLDVAALLNGEPGRARGRGEADDSADVPITLVPEYTSSGGEATIEDVFSESFYLEIVNRTYAEEIGAAAGVPDRLTPGELGTRNGEPIVEQLRSYFETHDVNGGQFDRGEPALHLQENRAEFAEELDQESRRQFTRLFRDLNNTLESFEGVEPQRKSLLETLGFG